MNINIKIFHENTELINRLKDKLLKVDSELEIAIYSNLEDFKKSTIKSDVVIMQYNKQLVEKDILYLNDSLIQDTKILLYTKKVTEIYTDIIQNYSQLTNKVQEVSLEKEGCKCYAFVGVSGNAGTTTIAKQIANEKAQSAKTLYISLNPLQEVEYTPKHDITVSNVIAGLKSRYADLTLKITASLNSEGNLHYFNVADDRFDYISISENEVESLILELEKMFEYIIFDVPMVFDNKTKTLLSKMTQIFFVSEKNNKEALTQLLNHWYKKEITPPLQQFKMILNKANENVKNCDLVIEKYDLPQELIASNIKEKFLKQFGIYF